MKIYAFAIIFEEKKFLLIRESNIKYQNKWFLPGGTVREDERVAETVIRETREQAGFDTAVNGVWQVKYISKPVSEKGLYIYCSCRVIAGKIKTDYDEKSMEARWFGTDEILQLETRGNLKEVLALFTEDAPLLPTGQIILSGN